MRSSLPKSVTRTFVAAGLSTLLAAFAPAAIVANFTDGNDTSAGGANAPTADSFSGAAAGGWAGAWATFNQNNPTITAGVQSAAPLSGGGNYLNVTVASVAANGNSQAGGLWRQYNNVGANAIDTTQAHTISWKFRLNSPSSSRSTTDANDQIIFIDNNSNFTGPAQTWAIIAQGGLNGGRFSLMNGNGSGGSSGVDTGIALANGKIYDFLITIRPGATAAETRWDATISDGTTTFTETGLRFRDVGQITDHRRIQFYGRNNNASEALDFSIDAVTIAVPEPAALGVFGTAAAGLLAMRRR